MAKPFLDNDFFRRYRRYYTYIEPITKDPLVKGYFTLVASIILVAIFLIFALSPTISTILGLLKKIDDEKALISQMDTKISNLVIAQDSYSQVENYLPLLDKALPQKPTPETVLPTLLTIASSSGVAVSSVGLSDVVLDVVWTPRMEAQAQEVLPGLVLPHVSFNMVVIGSSDQLRNFMGKLERTPRILRVYALSLTPATAGLTNNISANVLGTAFYLPP